MKVLLRSILVAVFSCFLLVQPPAAQPKISVEKAEIDVGLILEGKQKSAEAVFKIKNTGDKVLHINKVKPG